MAYSGSVDTITLTVDPYDNTTEVTVAVTPPSGGAPVDVPAASTDGRHTWLATPQWTEPGKWVAEWAVTGTGAGTTYQEIQVSRVPSPAALVTWRPELWNVAAYVPRRTLVGAVDGHGNAIEVFDNTTFPTSAVVARLITDACAWVAVVAGPVDESLVDAALAVAAQRAAGMVELGYPDNRDDLSNGDVLLKQAEAMRRDLAAANIALTAQDPATDADNLLPQYSFPAPAIYGDYLLAP